MLRWLAGGLVALNVGLFLWVTGHRQVLDLRTTTPRPPIQVEKMRLVNEPESPRSQITPVTEVAPMSPAPAPTPTTPTVAPSPAPATPAPARKSSNSKAEQTACFTAGPFDSLLAAVAGARVLEQQGVRYTQRATPDQGATAYRVFIGPFASAKVVEAERKKLTALGIKDHYVLREPGLTHTVSLGVFSQKATAEGYIRNLAAKGVKAKWEARRKDAAAYFLDLDPRTLGAEKLEALKLADWGDKQATLQSRPCPRD